MALLVDPGEVNPLVGSFGKRAQSMIAPGGRDGQPGGISATLSRQQRHYSQGEERMAKVAVITGSNGLM